jgi:alkylated DNA nucleotide flippase Atl1
MSDNEHRRRLDTVISDLIKRAVEIGVEKAVEAPDNLKDLVGAMKPPREVAHYLLSQVEETKTGLFRVVAKEMRDFLEHTNLASEMQKVLTTVQFEISTTIRFKPGESAQTDGDSPKLPRPEVSTEVQVKREDRPRERRRTRE